ncbi:MAG: signal peptidase II [Gemmatimonadetes bacterium]|nr:signal peptidase II [Gemmatimonadota bacterium]
MSTKWRAFAAIAGSVLVLDVSTKWWVRSAILLGDSVPVVGDWVRFTYVLNPGAAFGIQVGAWSRPVFTVLALVAIAVILAALRDTPDGERGRLAALALVGGGATGNLVDRVGGGAVVDFLDVGVGPLRWPVFNLADVGVTTGALLLVLLLWETDARPART